MSRRVSEGHRHVRASGLPLRNPFTLAESIPALPAAGGFFFFDRFLIRFGDGVVRITRGNYAKQVTPLPLSRRETSSEVFEAKAGVK